MTVRRQLRRYIKKPRPSLGFLMMPFKVWPWNVLGFTEIWLSTTHIKNEVK